MIDGAIRILCVEDEALVAQAMETILRSEPGFEFVGCIANAENLAAHVRAAKAQVVLLDLSMSGPDPLEELRKLAAECPEVRTIIASGRDDPDLIDQAVAAGAWGYFCKADSPQELLEGVRAVARDEFAIAPSVRRRIMGLPPKPGARGG